MISDVQRRARLGRRHRLGVGAGAATVEDAVDAVVALHSTDPASVFVSAWARMADGDVAAVEHALYEERSLLRVLAMRRTMFVAPVATASVLLAACSGDVARRERALLVKLAAAAGVSEADVDRAGDLLVGALADGGELTAVELAAVDPLLGTRLTVGSGKYLAEVSLASRLLTVLGAEGRVVRTRPRGGWTSTQFRWSAMSAWHGGVVDVEVEDARGRLAAAYLRAFGPALEADLTWWTGWTKTATRKALAACGAVEVALEGGATGFVCAGDEEDDLDAGAPWAALLPALDPTTMGWKARDWHLGAHAELLFDRNGNGGPTIWWDGRVVGGWALAPGAEVRVELLEDIGAEGRAAVEVAAGALAARVGEATLAPRARARSAVEARLLA